MRTIKAPERIIFNDHSMQKRPAKVQLPVVQIVPVVQGSRKYPFKTVQPKISFIDCAAENNLLQAVL